MRVAVCGLGDDLAASVLGIGQLSKNVKAVSAVEWD